MFEGLLNNFLITGGSCILPLVIGVASYFLCDKNKQLSKLAHFCGAFFESICPLLTIVVLYYCVFGNVRLNSLIVCIIGFSISFAGYMPARFSTDDSMLKNLAINGIGLFSTIFKWSFCVCFIGVRDMFNVANLQRARTYESNYLWIPFIISFGIIFILEIMRFVVKENMK